MLFPCQKGVNDVYRTVKITRPVTVAETQIFLRAAQKIWSAEELAELVDYVAHNPEAGDVVSGTGGVRKLRWGKAGTGKRGGARIVYFYYNELCPLYLLLAYEKRTGYGPDGRTKTGSRRFCGNDQMLDLLDGTRPD